MKLTYKYEAMEVFVILHQVFHQMYIVIKILIQLVSMPHYLEDQDTEAELQILCAACCTRTRWPIESLFGRESQLSLLGARTEVPNQLLSPCGIPNFDSQSKLMVWLQIGDSLLYHHGVPYSYKYGTVDTYQDHGHDIRQRIALENPLSSLSGIQWSRDDIFSRPRGQNPHTNQGQPIRRVSLLNPQQTGMAPVTPDELSSVTMGSFQYRLMRSYVTRLR